MSKPSATLTIIENEDETIDVKVVFDPPIADKTENPFCHYVMMAAFEAVKDYTR